MQRRDRTDAEATALSEVLAAVTELLDRLPATRHPDERAALGAAFDDQVRRVRADLARRYGLDEREAAAAVAAAAARIARPVPAASVYA